MIVTRKWLEEWIDLEGISTKDIVDTFNKIGLEVAEYKKLQIPDNVVVGRLISCQKHPNADKLNLCEVDVGEETLQIVCGAGNVKDAEYVAVAKVGAILPGDFRIKPAKLRGVESFGMICSSKELGLPEMEDGIMILDESIGELEVGKELKEYELLADEVIEIELTANRGDCLSVQGVARELSVVYGRPLKEKKVEEDSSIRVGIGRLVGIAPEGLIDSNLLYKAFKSNGLLNPLLIRFRVALTKERFENSAEVLAYYITHSTGVLTRIYGHRFFELRGSIAIKKDEYGYDAVYGEKKGSVVGVIQYEDSKPQDGEENFIIESSYIDPELISKKMFEHPYKSDWSFYRSSRGTDPRVGIGIEFAKYLLSTHYPQAQIYAGTHEVIKEIERKAIKIQFSFLYDLIGQEIDKSEIVEILKALGFEIVNVDEEAMVVKTPVYRHDIENLQDVAEEVVRIYGIDNIASKPLLFEEANRLTKAYEEYQKRKQLRHLAIAQGFFESVSYLFTNKEVLRKYGFETLEDSLDLLNPITKELDTLRPSLVPNLLEQTISNVRNGKKRVMLFEIGSVFDKKRREKSELAFIHAGYQEPDSVCNHGKPANVSFAGFVKELAGVLGDFELRETRAKHKLMHPFQSAAILQKGKEVGEVYKLATTIQEELDLPDTYMAQINLDALDLKYPKAKKYSIYQLSLKDLSLLVDRDIPYAKIAEILKEILPPEVKRFYPIDEYEDERLGEKKSVTLRFAIQSDKKTLTEEEIAQIMENILHELQTKLGVKLR